VNLDTLTREEVATWQPGETLLLNGKLLTGRDAAHKRIADHHARGERLPEGVDFRNRVIYYVGPSIRCATRSSVPRVPRPQRAWTSSRSSCWSTTASSP
jgi:tartrate dehydratase beta subunit/fumarate hydratase class I family protein